MRKKSILLSTTDLSSWSENIPVPEKQPFKAAYGTKDIPVLTVNRVGDWYGQMNVLDYPV
jgi:hypothetical protein